MAGLVRQRVTTTTTTTTATTTASPSFSSSLSWAPNELSIDAGRDALLQALMSNNSELFARAVQAVEAAVVEVGGGGVHGGGGAGSSSGVGVGGTREVSILGEDDEDAGLGSGWRATVATAMLICALIGLVGNALVILVVARVKHMRTPTNIYLVSLSVSDSLFFLAATPSELAFLIDADNYHFGTIGCGLQTYLTYLAINMSAINVTAFTLERFVGICYPLLARTMCTRRRAVMITSGLWAVVGCYDILWFALVGYTRHDDGSSSCDFNQKRDSFAYKTVFFVDILVFYVLPMVASLVIYARIFTVLYVCDKGLGPDGGGKMSTSSALLSGTSSPQIQKHTTGTFGTGNGDSRQHKNNASQTTQIVRMLTVVFAVFALLWLPYRGMVAYNSFADYRFSPDWFVYASKICIFVNCGINPILYNAMSSRFRQAFRELLGGKRRRGWRPPGAHTTTTTTTARRAGGGTAVEVERQNLTSTVPPKRPDSNVTKNCTSNLRNADTRRATVESKANTRLVTSPLSETVSTSGTAQYPDDPIGGEGSSF